MIARLSHVGEIVIIGDTNCHFRTEYGNRFWGKSTTKNAKCLMYGKSMHRVILKYVILMICVMGQIIHFMDIV